MNKITEFEDYVETWWDELIQTTMDNIDNKDDEEELKAYQEVCKKLNINEMSDLSDGLEIYQKVILNNPGFSGIPSPYDFINEFIEDNFYVKYNFQWNFLEEIANHIIEYDDPKKFFEDISYGGCKSGIIGSLVYNDDCKRIYIDNIDDIEEYFKSLEDELGIKINDENELPRYTFVCWVCFEELCRQLSVLFE